MSWRERAARRHRESFARPEEPLRKWLGNSRALCATQSGTCSARSPAVSSYPVQTGCGGTVVWGSRGVPSRAECSRVEQSQIAWPVVAVSWDDSKGANPKRTRVQDPYGFGVAACGRRGDHILDAEHAREALRCDAVGHQGGHPAVRHTIDVERAEIDAPVERIAGGAAEVHAVRHASESPRAAAAVILLQRAPFIQGATRAPCQIRSARQSGHGRSLRVPGLHRQPGDLFVRQHR